jgi:hypothetical protein
LVGDTAGATAGTPLHSAAAIGSRKKAMGKYDIIAPHSGGGYMIGLIVAAAAVALVVYFVRFR